MASDDRRRYGVRAGVGTTRLAWALAGLFIALPVATPADAATAAEIAASVCAPCHGAAGVSPAPAFPNLAGQQPEYVAKQLADFARGKRQNEIMAPVIAQLGSADFAGLAAYYGAQSPARGAAADATLAATGRKLFADGDVAAGIPPCASCHQPGGAGHTRYPRLAAQPAAYTEQQLASFRAGARHNDKRHVMRDVAARLSDAQMQALAAYLAGL